MTSMPDADKRIGKASRTPKPCSCCCCGNPRRHFEEPTLRERIVASEPIYVPHPDDEYWCEEGYDPETGEDLRMQLWECGSGVADGNVRQCRAREFAA